ncbi:MAG: glycosyltransferase family 39 protein [Candidatus Omnitrophica bacterium]|nr:glycosyltransferase family 39 protein [Candidatus Omnitrophota bacterium]
MNAAKLYKHSYIIILLLAAGFLLRLYAATTVPLIKDEEEKVAFTREISFDFKDPNLPLGDREIASPLLDAYILKFGFAVFGESNLGGRLFFVFLGALGLYFIYKLVEEQLGKGQGLLVLVFLVLSQFHIGMSRLIDEDCLLLFFTALSIYLFFKALNTKKRIWTYLTGISVGLGFLGKDPIILLLPIFFFFLLSRREYRFWFRSRDTYIAFALALIIASPYILWSYKNNFYNYIIKDFDRIGISLRSFYLYFGEILSWFTEKFDFFIWGPIKGQFHEGAIAKINGKWRMIIDGSNEFPVIDWVLGVFSFAGFFYCLKGYKKRKALIQFCIIMFGSIFIITTILRGPTLFDDHWWGDMTLYPGVILCAHMLIKLKERYKFVNLAIAGLIIYFAINCFYFINLPENEFTATRSALCKYYLERAEIYLEKGEREEAIKRCKWVIKRCSDEKILKRSEVILRKLYSIF